MMRQQVDEGFECVRATYLPQVVAMVDNTEVAVDALLSLKGDDAEQILIFDRRGRGTIYGEVRFAQLARLESGTKILHWIPDTRKAVKIFSREKIRQLRIAEDHVSEFNLQLRFSGDNQHPNVMPLDVIYTDASNIYAVMPFSAGGELFDLVSAPGAPLCELHVKEIFYGMVCGVHHLHSHGVVHRDVSLENFTLASGSSPFRPILIDFGLAYKLRPKAQGMWEDIPFEIAFGKPNYISPEYFLISQLSRRNPDRTYPYSGIAQDVWALGVCLFMLAFRARPWRIPYQADPDYRSIVQNIGPDPRELYGLHAWMVGKGWMYHTNEHVYIKGDRTLSESFVDLMQRILRQEPRERLSTAQILEHPWLAEFYH